MSAKQVKIHLSRAIIFNRKGKEPLELQAGANTVDADVAEHAFIKAHLSDPNAEAIEAGDPELQAKYDEVVKANEAGSAIVAKANAKIAALEKQLAGVKDGKAIAEANAKIAALEAQVAEKDSVIAAYEAASK